MLSSIPDWVKQHQRACETALLTLIIITSAYLRLTNLETTWIGGDQSALLSTAMEFVNQGKIPLAANKSSAGIFNPPLVEYLYALPLFLTRRIISVVWLTALANLASVGLCYGFARRLFGVRVAMMSTFLYAASPWSVHFSRMIWNPTTIPFFSTLALGCLSLYFSEDQKPGWLIGAAISLAGVVQLHWASVVLIGVVGICGLLFHKRLKIAPVLIGIILFAVTFIPYYLFERATGFMDVTSFLQAMEGKKQINLASALLAGDLVSAQGVLQLKWPTLNVLMRWWLWISLTYLGLIGLLSVRTAWESKLSSRKTARLIVFLWIAVPIAAYLQHTHYLQHHYFLYLYPALYIAIAITTDDAVSSLRSLGKNGETIQRRAIQVAATTPLAMLAFISGYYFYANANELSMSNQARCVQLRHVTAAIDQVQALLNKTHSHNLIVLNDGVNASSSTLGLIRHWLGSEVKVRFTRLGDGVPIPQDSAVYLMAGDDPQTAALLSKIGESVEKAQVTTPCNEWDFYTSQGASVTEKPGEKAVARWANGLSLLDYRLEGEWCPGNEIELTANWTVNQTNQQEHYRFFNHLISSEDKLVSQYDGPGVSSLYWHPGDRLVTWFSIPIPSDLPPGSYDIYAGLYTWPHLERIPIIPTNGSDDRLRLTSVTVKACEK